jgi:hypothetical protein
VLKGATLSRKGLLGEYSIGWGIAFGYIAKTSLAVQISYSRNIGKWFSFTVASGMGIRAVLDPRDLQLTLTFGIEKLMGTLEGTEKPCVTFERWAGNI